MLQLLYLIVLTSIWILGLTLASQEEMIFNRWRLWAEERKSKIWKAVILCVWCMPSIHSLVGYAFAVGIGIISEFSWRLIVFYPLVVMGSSILSGLTWTLYLLIDNLVNLSSVVGSYCETKNECLKFEIRKKKRKFRKQLQASKPNELK